MMCNVQILVYLQDDGTKGDNFMNMVESVASSVPYMTIPGNHEEQE